MPLPDFNINGDLPPGIHRASRTEVTERFGWQQLDLLVRRRDELDEPLAALAQATGIKL